LCCIQSSWFREFGQQQKYLKCVFCAHGSNRSHELLIDRLANVLQPEFININRHNRFDSDEFVEVEWKNEASFLKPKLRCAARDSTGGAYDRDTWIYQLKRRRYSGKDGITRALVS